MPKRHYPPAKKRYEQRHPTVSFRCQDREEYEYIAEMAKRHGMSKAQYVRQALYSGIEECDTAYNEGYWKGYRQGFCSGVMQAYFQFGIFYVCPKCKKMIMVPMGSKPHIEAARFLVNEGWQHTDCNKPLEPLQIADKHATVHIIQDGDIPKFKLLND